MKLTPAPVSGSPQNASHKSEASKATIAPPTKTAVMAKAGNQTQPVKPEPLQAAQKKDQISKPAAANTTKTA